MGVGVGVLITVLITLRPSVSLILTHSRLPTLEGRLGAQSLPLKRTLKGLAFKWFIKATCACFLELYPHQPRGRNVAGDFRQKHHNAVLTELVHNTQPNH